MRFATIHQNPTVASAVAFTIRGTLTLYGRSVSQTQYVSDRYVATQVDRGMFIFLASRGERFLVDRGVSRLRRIEPDVQRIRVDRLREVIGDMRVTRHEELVEMAGHSCTRFTFENSAARIVIAGETLVARVPGIEETVLQAERDHDAANQPFALPLEPDQVVVASRLRTVATDFEQNQAYSLCSIEPRIETVADLDRIARLAIIG